MGTGASALSGLTPGELEYYERITSFDKKQLQRLWKRFNLLDSDGSCTISREEFRLLPELAGNPLTDRILDCLESSAPAPDAADDPVAEHSGEVDFSMFVQSLDVFCAANSNEKKLKMLFKMYDVDGDGGISASDLRSTFQRLVGVSTSRQQIEAMVKAVMSQCDPDGDQTLSLADFSRMIDEDELHARMTLAI